MALELCTLASGSSGNCSILRASRADDSKTSTVVLIDAGIGPRTFARRLCGTGASIADVRAIVLTHLDRDHFTPAWCGIVVQNQIELFLHAGRVDDALRICRAFGVNAEMVDAFRRRLRGFAESRFDVCDGLAAAPLALAHDRDGSHAFVFDGFGSRVGLATDLGHVPRALLDHFCNLDILAIESNYDAALQVGSERPEFLKQRIMGGRGHLSNR